MKELCRQEAIVGEGRRMDGDVQVEVVDEVKELREGRE
jgi:hypothetical protein